MSDTDLVSCLCITDSRVELLKNAVDCFLSQSYIKKELIIVYAKEDKDTENYLATVDLSIKSVAVSRGSPLGALRNIALEWARGDYICIWDDDDWHHPDRIDRQLKAAKFHHKQGSILVMLLLQDCVNNESYLSHRSNWDGTLLVKRSAIISDGIKYPNKNLAEDTPFTIELLKKNYLYPLTDPCLYVYRFTGSNSWSLEHFQCNFALGDKLPPTHTEMLNKALLADVVQGGRILDSFEFRSELNFFIDLLRQKGIVSTPAFFKLKLRRRFKNILKYFA